ncbi:MAG: MBL fold metallo-hydrolase [Halanaerobiales bacterium]
MALNQTKVYHLFHSGVAVKIGEDLLVFDYYKDNPSGEDRDLTNGVISEKNLEESDNIYGFVSHRHSDHYNPTIFNWEDKTDNVYYILSNDINVRTGKDNYIFVNKDEELEVNEVEIKTFGSTDLGVSFLVKHKEVTIFHAGDLNWWHWKNNSREDQKQEEEDYKQEIAKIVKEDKIDIAFVPVDPRLDEYYYLAGEYFLRKVEPEVLIPIHFSSNYDITSEFAQKMNNSNFVTDIKSIQQRGQEINF